MFAIILNLISSKQAAKIQEKKFENEKQNLLLHYLYKQLNI
jgi:hypothetical protein